MRGVKRTEGSGTIALLEEVFKTARSLPASAWALYFLATLPLVIGFLYFWGDMANDARAWSRLGPWSLALAALFVWTKTGQTLFTRRVLAHVMGDFDPPRPRVRGIVVNQLVIQATGFLVLPLALIVIAPFGWVYAVYQNATVLDDGRGNVRGLFRESRRQAGLNVAQNNYMLWLVCPYAVGVAAAFFLIVMPVMKLFSPEWTDFFMTVNAGIVALVLIPLCPFGMAVALNVASALLILPRLLRMLLGIESAFTISPGGTFGPTFLVTVVCLTYLCLDPLVKIAYTLRCFYGDSFKTGNDLRIRLGRLAQSGVLGLAIVGGVLAPMPSAAQEASDSVSALNNAIEETLQDRRFTWREPRERPEAVEIGWVSAIIDTVTEAGRWIVARIEEFVEWLVRLFTRDGRQRQAMGMGTDALVVSAMVLTAAILIGLLFLVYRTWRRPKIVVVDPVAATPEVPDLEDEGTAADALASQEWLNLAAELMAKGEFRLAMRAYFFAGLARLGQLHLIRISSYKSNREYARELQRVEHARADVVGRFNTGMRLFESVWYGNHTLAHADLQHYVESQRWISRCE